MSSNGKSLLAVVAAGAVILTSAGVAYSHTEQGRNVNSCVPRVSKVGSPTGSFATTTLLIKCARTPGKIGWQFRLSRHMRDGNYLVAAQSFDSRAGFRTIRVVLRARCRHAGEVARIWKAEAIVNIEGNNAFKPLWEGRVPCRS